VLSLPFLILTLGFAGLQYLLFFCSTHLPLWQFWLDTILPLCVGGILLVAIGGGVLRTLLLRHLLAKKPTYPAPALHVFADPLAQQIGAPYTRIRICLSNRPLALTAGLFHPTIFLSQWMLKHLDQQELEAVLAHELAHVAQHDTLIMLSAIVLRDAFFYLPSSQRAYRHLQQEKELLCDEQAANVTHRPLALASALTKVWLHAVENPSFTHFGAAHSLLEGHETITHRIERLLHGSPQAKKAHSSPLSPLRVGLPVLLSTIIAQGLNLLLILSLLCCVF